MSVTPAGARRVSTFAILLLAVGRRCCCCRGAFDALAQGIAVRRAARAAPAPPPPDGIIGWMLAKQAEFYSPCGTMLRNAKADGSAVWGLLGISFLYGIFHAAGPGHGKAVISSYVVANNETWRRGVVLSFASALLQAFVAVAIVGIAAWCSTPPWRRCATPSAGSRSSATR